MRVIIFSFKLLPIIGFVIISGCSQLVTKQAEMSNSSNKYSIKQVRVYLKSGCPITTPEPTGVKEASLPAILFGIIGPKLIESGVDIIGKSIINASGKNDNTKTITASTSGYFYENVYNEESRSFVTTKSNKVKCLVFIKGSFGTKQTVSANWVPDFEKNRLTLTEYDIDGVPDIFLQARIYTKASDSRIVITPTFIWYGKKLNKRGYDEKRDLQLVFTISNPDKSKDNVFSTGIINLEDITVGHYYKDQLANISTNLMLPPNQEVAFTNTVNMRNNLINEYKNILEKKEKGDKPKGIELEKEKVIYQKCLLKQKKEYCDREKKIRLLTWKIDYKVARDKAGSLEKVLESQEAETLEGGPFVLKVAAIETRDINEWLAALGEAITSSKAEISSEISTALIPSLKKKKEQEALADKISKQSAYLSAMVDVEIAAEKFKQAETAGDDINILIAQKDLIVKKLTANSKALEAGLGIPFPELL